MKLTVFVCIIAFYHFCVSYWNWYFWCALLHMLPFFNPIQNLEFLSSEPELLHLGSVCLSVCRSVCLSVGLSVCRSKKCQKCQKLSKKCQNMSKKCQNMSYKIGRSIHLSICLSVGQKNVKKCQKSVKTCQKGIKTCQNMSKMFKPCQNKSKKDVLFSMTVLPSKLRNS